VIAAIACLVAAKVANVGVPVILKHIVDGLDAKSAMLLVPLALLVAYGALRLSTTLFTELREILFIRVTQRAVRTIALKTFRHLHALSLRFHLSRQTGGLTRDVERGTRGISTLIGPGVASSGAIAAVVNAASAFARAVAASKAFGIACAEVGANPFTGTGVVVAVLIESIIGMTRGMALDALASSIIGVGASGSVSVSILPVVTASSAGTTCSLPMRCMIRL
jgi:ABC-type multidrug transport system fused ATPase/permease subunit